MNNWKHSENKAYEWFKKNIDSYAIHKGEENSYCGDIYSPLYNSYIEVKDINNGARCGQFTEFTIKNNPFAQALFEGKTDLLTCQQFIQHHYINKNVTHFIIIDNGQINFYSLDEFLEKYNFELQNPYAKRSGTRKAPKKDIELLLKADRDFVLNEDGRGVLLQLISLGRILLFGKTI